MSVSASFDNLCINTIRTLAMDAVQKADSGHPGMPMGAAPMAYVLWTKFLKHDPAEPTWPDRDRFVLSAGHGSMLLYSLLHLSGYDLSLDEIKKFRQWQSKTPGHPEHGLTAGVETTTGPLGQGFANGVGMAMAEAHLAAVFNRPGLEIVNHYTYGIVSDGDLMEGIASEAASLAGHLKLGKLIYLYDDNHITIDGSTDLTFTEDRAARFRAYGWHVQTVNNGNDLQAIEAAISAARDEKEKPSLICVNTIIGYGSPNKQGTAASHGEALGVEEVALAKKQLDWPVNGAFHIPEDVLALTNSSRIHGQNAYKEWQQKFEKYMLQYPDLAEKFLRALRLELPPGWDKDIPVYAAGEKNIATRNAGGQTLNAIASHVSELVSGSADLTSSNKTDIKNKDAFGYGNYHHRTIHFGVREHAMAGISNGMALHRGVRPIIGTFLIFSDYMRPSIRLAALMQQPVIYVFTHDSIGLGEDGPTHQPIEQLACLRAIPNLIVIRPCDANETAEAWRFVMQYTRGPVALALTRQNIPVLDRKKYAPAKGLHKGAYILLDSPDKSPELILIATGSEVWPTLLAGEKLLQNGIPARVVSMPSWEIFEKQSKTYREKVFPSAITARLAVEAGTSFGWAKYVGEKGATITIDNRFGASAPWELLMQEYGFTVENIMKRALQF
jgi:transketolase